MFTDVLNISKVTAFQTESGSIYLVAETTAGNHYLHTMKGASGKLSNGAVLLPYLPEQGQVLRMFRGKSHLTTSPVVRVVNFPAPDRRLCGHLRAAQCSCTEAPKGRVLRGVSFRKRSRVFA